MRRVKNNDYLSEIFWLAADAGIAVPSDFNYGVKTSAEKDSQNGEKTKKSIIKKVSRKILNENLHDFKVIDVTDLIRATFVLEKYEHLPVLMDIMKQKFPDLLGELAHYPKRGYRGLHLGTNHIDGLCADIHLVTPLQDISDRITHGLYDKSRELPEGSAERKNIEQISKKIYEILWENTDFLVNDLKIRSRVVDYGKELSVNDTKRLPQELVEKLSEPLLSFEKKLPVLDEDKLENQAEAAQYFAAPRQKKLKKICDSIFDEYKARRREGRLVTRPTQMHRYYYSMFSQGLEDKETQLLSQGVANPPKHIKDNYGEIIAQIETDIIKPAQDNAAQIGGKKKLNAIRDYKQIVASNEKLKEQARN